MNKRILTVVAGIGVLAVGFGINTKTKEVYEKYKESKERQKEINKVRERQKELMEEFKQCEMDSERHKELIKEIKECNNKLMEYWKR